MKPHNLLKPEGSIKIRASYEVRGSRIDSYISIPEPNIQNLTAALKHVAWVAGRAVPEIEISEG